MDPNNVRIYACGPTVYDWPHIGNARPAVVFDILYRLMRENYGDRVTYVRNITDVDDKINARALKARNEGDDRPLTDIVRTITNQTVDWYRTDMRYLSVLSPDHEPRATEFIPEMIRLIERLIRRGCAYAAEAHVLFSVDAFEDYGSFSGRSPADMEAGARVEVAPYKRNPMDFVLWKPSAEDEPGWDSPWGRGRPGWHIECSAMSLKLLGADFDIHAGGSDLIFPHHENEIAQSMCANPGSKFARLWMHNGLLLVEGRKMAKSLGNFITVKALRDQGIAGDAIRLALLSTHYRFPLDWTERRLSECVQTINRWKAIAGSAEAGGGKAAPEIAAALSDDLNTPQAIASLHRLAKSGDCGALKASAGLLGLLTDDCDSGKAVDGSVQRMIERLLQKRDSAREERRFSEADAIRNHLLTAGVEIRDSSDGTEWCATVNFDSDQIKSVISDFSSETEGESDGT